VNHHLSPQENISHIHVNLRFYKSYRNEGFVSYQMPPSSSSFDGLGPLVSSHTKLILKTVGITPWTEA
jgi:hypothetical protein